MLMLLYFIWDPSSTGLQVKVFWVGTSCRVVIGYQCFRGPCCHHLHPGDGGSKVLQNGGILP